MPPVKEANPVIAAAESKTESVLDRRLEAAPLESERLKLQGLRAKVPVGESTKPRLDGAINEFLKWLVDEQEIVTDDALETLAALIAKLDEKLSEQINLIIHNPEFQKLEGSWRGLEHMVFGTETDKDLKIKVLNITKDELSKEFKTNKGSKWDKGYLFHEIYTKELGTPGGQPFGVLIGDYEFSNGAADVAILKGIGQIASAAHAPFIAGTAPSMFNLKSWTDVAQVQDMAALLEGPEWASWRGFRESLDARYVGLTLPRFLSRLPYGKDNKVDGFDFVETCEGGDHSKYTWSNAAYAMGTNITQAHKYYGWTACIRGKNSGGELSGLHVHTFPTADGGTEMKCPSEVNVDNRMEHELSKLGFAAVQHYKNTDTAAFTSAPNCYLPQEYDDPSATANSRLNGALPYVFVTSRFAHYLNKMLLEAVGSFQDSKSLENWLDNWIHKYVTKDPNASQKTMAEKPLREAEVTVEEIAGRPGYYTAVFKLRPHYQLEGVDISLRLVGSLDKKN